MKQFNRSLWDREECGKSFDDGSIGRAIGRSRSHPNPQKRPFWWEFDRWVSRSGRCFDLDENGSILGCLDG